MIHIFLVETTSKNKSDEMYIRSLLSFRYDYAGDKLKFIYLEGKGNYFNKQKEINRLKANFNNNAKVYMCIDLDNDIKMDNNSILNDKIYEFCLNYNYEYIWFNEDIEQVFLGHSIAASVDKKREAEKFFSRDVIKSIDLKMLKYEKNIRLKTSNIIKILDEYFKIK